MSGQAFGRHQKAVAGDPYDDSSCSATEGNGINRVASKNAHELSEQNARLIMTFRSSRPKFLDLLGFMTCSKGKLRKLGEGNDSEAFAYQMNCDSLTARS